MNSSEHTFRSLAPLYRQAGYWPRPVKPGTKAPPMRNWQWPDPEWKLGDIEGWAEAYPSFGIGLVLGTPLPDGSKLAVIDIDRNDYVRGTCALLRDPQVGRVGEKGIAYFARIRGDGKYRALKAPGAEGYKVGEILCDNRFVVIPPTIHPNTAQSYRWIGRPLLEVSYSDLPLIEA